MNKPVIVLDPGHGGLTSFFYDLDNGVRLSYTWDEIRGLDSAEKLYFCPAACRRWQEGELPVEPRFYFERKGRKVTYGDPGNVSPLDPRICEKDLVLDLARSMHREIGRKLLVKSTRDRDGYVADSNRVAYANRMMEKFEAETLFLSLHTESSPDPEAWGLRLRHEPQVSARLLERFEISLVRHLRETGLEETPVVVEEQRRPDLEGLEMPALTVVVGFLSNVADAQRLLERARRQQLAGALSHAAVQYLNEVERTGLEPFDAALDRSALTPAVLSEGLA